MLSANIFVLFLLLAYISTVVFCVPRLPTRNSKLQGSCESREALWCAEGRERRPVCGTDDVTYSSRCALVQEQCRRTRTPPLSAGFLPKLYMKHKGPCANERLGAKEMPTCWAAAERSKAVFVPHCLSDGTFAPVQCHQATNTCWCVNIHGEPMSNIVKNGKPVCHRAGKRRIGVSGVRGGRNRKECGKIEKSNFFSNMDNIYRVEYNRTLTSPSKLSDEEFGKTALKWKFTSLDLDNNGTLIKYEYSDLRRLVRKAVKPRECARDFLRLCDSDRDLSITLAEWTTCHSQPRIKRRNNGRKRERDRHNGNNNLQAKHVPLRINSNVYEQSSEDTVEKQDHQEATDCLSDKRAVLEEMKPGNEQTYVPECTPDGRYQKIQCYKSTGYCWCVQQDTGKPIPGTSVKDPNPKCDAVPTPPRPMKGCPEPKKQAFMKDLIEYMNQTLKGKDMSLEHSQVTMTQSDQQKIATRTFVSLDANKNKVLERSEWKDWRIKLTGEKKLRRCGKKLPRYCDVNHDKKISLTEWLNCVTPPTTSSGPGEGRRRGKNPFEIFLKDD